METQIDKSVLQRKAEKLIDGEWKPIDNKDIKKGDIIRMFELNGILDYLTGKGVLATSDALKQTNGEWGFQADMTPQTEPIMYTKPELKPKSRKGRPKKKVTNR